MNVFIPGDNILPYFGTLARGIEIDVSFTFRCSVCDHIETIVKEYSPGNMISPSRPLGSGAWSVTPEEKLVCPKHKITTKITDRDQT
jgi:hypothetical protein